MAEKPHRFKKRLAAVKKVPHKKKLYAAVAVLLCVGAMGVAWAAANAVGDKVASFVNERNEQPDLIVSKKVTAPDGYTAPSGESFDFIIKVKEDGFLKPYAKEKYRLYDAAGNEIFDEVDGVQKPFYTSSTGRFSLKDGEKVKFEYVGNNAVYEITEEEADGYLQVEPVAGTAAAGTVDPKGSEVSFVNEYQPPTPPTPDPDPEGDDDPNEGKLIVTKSTEKSDGLDVSDNASFDFTVKVNGKPLADAEYRIEGSGKGEKGTTDSDGGLSLKSDQKAVFENLPEGADYEVKEKLPDGWRQISAKGDKGSIKAAGSTASFTNSNISFRVKKTTSSGNIDDDFVFTITDEDGKPVSGLKYAVTDNNGSVVNPFASKDEYPDAIDYTLTADDVAAGVDLPDGTHVTLNSGDVSIPEYIVKDGKTYRITEIGNYAFRDCSSLASITIPDSVTSIGVNAFNMCRSLESVTIPDSVTSIGGGAFQSCTALKNVTIPDSMDEIGAFVFRGCSSLKNVTQPDSVTSIGQEVFSGCSKLKNVTIPDSVTEIMYRAFYSCGTLYYNGSATGAPWGAAACEAITQYTLTADDVAAGVDLPDGTHVTLNSGDVSIPEYIVKDGKTYRIASIGDEAFENCTSLASVTIPDSVTYIGEGAFHGCTSLESVTIPDSVTSIGTKVFYGCTSLESITIPDSVTKIENYAFVDCTSLASVTIPDSVTSIRTGAFYKCTSLASVTIPDSVRVIEWNAFSGCTSLASVTIPGSVTSIEKSAFYGCGTLYYSGSATGSPWGAKEVKPYSEAPENQPNQSGTTDSAGRFILKAGQTAVFVGLENGTKFNVSEEPKDGFVQKEPASEKGYEHQTAGEGSQLLVFDNEVKPDEPPTPDEPETGSLKLLKQTETGEPVGGVVFAVESEALGYYEEKTTGDDGIAYFGDLELGDYTITEVSTVGNLSLLASDIKVSIPKTMTTEDVEAQNADKDKGVYNQTTDTWSFYDLTYTITDYAKMSLPNTGNGLDWTVIVIIGSIAVIVAYAAYRFSERKKENLPDPDAAVPVDLTDTDSVQHDGQEKDDE